jgi:hypothetical protein
MALGLGEARQVAVGIVWHIALQMTVGHHSL